MKFLFIFSLCVCFVIQDSVYSQNVFMNTQGLPAGIFSFILGLSSTSVPEPPLGFWKLSRSSKSLELFFSLKENMKDNTWYGLCSDNEV